MNRWIILLIIFGIPIYANGQELSEVQRETLVLSVASLEEYNKKAVSKFQDAEPFYDEKKKEFTFKVNKTSREKSWRLVHNGKDVLCLFESDGYTRTIYYLYQAKTIEKCLDEIDRLNLKTMQDWKANYEPVPIQ